MGGLAESVSGQGSAGDSLAAQAPGRAVCPVCARPQTTCLCAWVRPVVHPVQVLVLQHPMEVHEAKGTARLLCLSLPGSRLQVGEVFAPADLQAWLHGPWPGDAASAPARQPLLLYPPTVDNPDLGLAPAAVFAPAPQADPAHWRLVVLDGTWRKSRKMLFLNPLLQTLPRLALHNVAASRYRIRKAHLPDQLSTLEATCAALAQLGGNAAPLESLLQGFDDFVAQQMALRPSS